MPEIKILPKRIQRKRTKGWKSPDNTFYVGRPFQWGNPFKVMGNGIYLDCSYRRKNLDPWVFLCFGKAKDVVKLYKHLFQLEPLICLNARLRLIDPVSWDTKKSNYHNADLHYWVERFSQLDLSELKGKNLACFCGPEQPCHADVLLELANPAAILTNKAYSHA